MKFSRILAGLDPWDKAICLLSLLLGIAYFVLMPPQFTSDSLEYYAWGLKTLHLPGGRFPYHRTSGYPLLMVATGVYLFHNFTLLYLVQMAMAVASPLLVYFAVKPFHQRAAFIAMLLAMILCAGYAYARVVFTEAEYSFGLALLFYLAIRYIKTQKGLWLLLAIAVVTAAVKPTAEPLLLMLLAAFYLLSSESHRVRIKQYGAVLLAFLAISATESVIRYYKIDPIVERVDSPEKFRHSEIASLTGGTSVAARMFFWQVYGGLINYNIINSNDPPYFVHGRSLVAKDNGPASAELFSVLGSYLHKHKENWVPLGPDSLFGVYKDDPDKLLQQMFERPNLIYHWFIWAGLDANLGPRKAGNLLEAVSWEALKAHPFAAFGLMDNVNYFFFGPSRLFSLGVMRAMPPFYCCLFATGDPLSPDMRDLITHDYQAGLPLYNHTLGLLEPLLIWLWVIVRTAGAMVAFLTLIPGLQSRFKPVILVCWAFIIPQALLTGIFAGADSRYINVTLGFIFIAAGLGVAALCERRRYSLLAS